MSDFMDTVKALGTTAAKKAADLAETGAVKAQIIKKKSDIKDVYAKIGEYLYANKEGMQAVCAEDQTLADLFAALDTLNTEINDLNNQLEIGKAE